MPKYEQESDRTPIQLFSNEKLRTTLDHAFQNPHLEWDKYQEIFQASRIYKEGTGTYQTLPGTFLEIITHCILDDLQKISQDNIQTHQIEGAIPPYRFSKSDLFGTNIEVFTEQNGGEDTGYTDYDNLLLIKYAENNSVFMAVETKATKPEQANRSGVKSNLHRVIKEDHIQIILNPLHTYAEQYKKENPGISVEFGYLVVTTKGARNPQSERQRIFQENYGGIITEIPITKDELQHKVQELNRTLPPKAPRNQRRQNLGI